MEVHKTVTQTDVISQSIHILSIYDVFQSTRFYFANNNNNMFHPLDCLK